MIKNFFGPQIHACDKSGAGSAARIYLSSFCESLLPINRNAEDILAADLWESLSLYS
ncbi:hypothetical protein NIASO_02445 [Niabella soli DSM 19437]|uniref:Uncharacterized protein n=1 Tax=Niabella soli DSM 19437 TaxID=929713 RepID=W0F2B4_9BACT|nr:hypothetical protein NIASO_02445 [Niabella soli DSM 19437]